MKRIMFAAVLCGIFIVVAAAQETGIEGTWVTDGVAVFEAAKAAGKPLSNIPEALTVKLKVDTKKNTVSGSVTEMVGNSKYDLKDGKVKDKTFTFNSVESGASRPTPIAWQGELTDSNTVTLTRVSAAGQPVGKPVVLHRELKK